MTQRGAFVFALLIAAAIQDCAFFMDSDLDGYGPAGTTRGPDASGSADAVPDTETIDSSAGGSSGEDGSTGSGGFAGTAGIGGTGGGAGTGGIGGAAGAAGGAGADASAGSGGAAGAGGAGGADASAGAGGMGGSAGIAGSGASGGGGFDAGLPCLVEVAGGFGHACGRGGDGSVWCWGENDYGQLGNGTTTGQPCGSVVCRPQPAQVPGLGASVVEVTAGRGHTCVRKGDGSIWCWGMDVGELSDAGQNCGGWSCEPSPAQITAIGTSAVQVTVGFGHTCVRKNDGTVWCWGGNQYGSLGDGTTIGKPSPVQVTALGTTAVEVVAGGNHTCARKSDGTVWCWGANGHGQLGDGTITSGAPYGKPSPVQVTALGTSAIEVEPGYDFTCARKNDGTLWCWGNNETGQLGDGTTNAAKPSPAQVPLASSVAEVAAGGAHTCARTTNGAVWCWGFNDYGAVGDGTTSGQTCGSVTCKPSPVEVASLGTSASYIAAGWYQTCARKADGSMWCWGDNTYGQIGDGTTASPQPLPVQISGACQ